MKLNYRDKVVLITVLVILVWVAGIMLFIKPKFQDLNAAKTELSSKKVELKDKEDRVAADADLPQRVEDAFATANIIASNFYPKLTSDEVSATIDELLDEFNITNENLTISTYSSVILQAIYANVEQVTTPLDTIATTPLEGEEENAVEAEPVVTQITMPCYTVAFAYKCDLEDLEDFLDVLIMQGNSTGDEKASEDDKDSEDKKDSKETEGEPKSLVVVNCDIVDVNGIEDAPNVAREDVGKVNGTCTMVLMMVPELQNPLEDPNDKADTETADDNDEDKEADKGSDD